MKKEKVLGPALLNMMKVLKAYSKSQIGNNISHQTAMSVVGAARPSTRCSAGAVRIMSLEGWERRGQIQN